MQLRSEIFCPELYEALEEDESDEEFQGYNGYYNKQVSANKKRQYERNQIIMQNIQKGSSTEEERKIMRNYLDEETLDDEYKKATRQFFGNKDDHISPNKQ